MKFIKKTLKNGLRVVVVPMKDNPTATVLVLVEAGSEYENKEINGISHFLEHVCFKGTKKRPKAIDIVKELDSIGSQNNAFTSTEYTGYYAKANANKFNKIFDVISDIYLNSTFPEVEVEKEKGVIIEEINMYEDMPHQEVQNLITKVLYGDQPAGWKISGEKENIKNISRDDIVNYRNDHYLPESTVIVVAGKVEPKEVFKKVEEVFGNTERGKKKKKTKTLEKQSSPQVLLEFKQTDQSHFVLAFRSFDLFNKKNPALAVLSGVLGAGMSSRLFQRLREEMGVGYYVRAYNDASLDHGFFQISAGVDNKRIEEVLKEILIECEKLKNTLVPEDELKKTKEFLIGNMKLSLESSDDIANFYGTQEILKKEIVKPEVKAKKIKEVTAKDVQKVAREIFQNNKMNFAMIGPVKDDKSIKSILKF